MFVGGKSKGVLASIDDVRIVSFQLLYLAYTFRVVTAVTMRSVLDGCDLSETEAVTKTRNASAEAEIDAFRSSLVTMITGNG